MKKIVCALLGVLMAVLSYGQDTITESYPGYMFWPHSLPINYMGLDQDFFVYDTFFWEHIIVPDKWIYGVSLRGGFPVDSSINISLAVKKDETVYTYYDTAYLDSSARTRYLKCEVMFCDSLLGMVDKCNEVYFHRPWPMSDTFYVVIRYGDNSNGQYTRRAWRENVNDTVFPQRYCVYRNGVCSPFFPQSMPTYNCLWGHEFLITEPNPSRCGKPTWVYITGRGAGWVSLAWNSAAGDGYQVTVEGPDDTIVTTTTDTTILLNNLVTEGLYWVRVRSLCRYQYYGYDSTFVNPESASVGIRVSGDGVSELDADPQIGLYPNPATASVTLDGLSVGATVTLVDLSGRTVMTFTAREKTQLIDVTPLSRGTYFVRVTDARNAAVYKLIVQ